MNISNEIKTDVNNTIVPVKISKNKLIITSIKLACYNFTKRAFDIIVGLIGTVFLSFIILLAFVMKKIEKDDGPLFYKQPRIGKNGTYFNIYKIRTMVVDADEKLKRYLKENPSDALYFKKYRKLKNDPRITKNGKFLRETSLDEWPQFFNVLIGNMSVIGPRPYMQREIEDMGDYYNTIIKVKPGITGYWQVNGRSNTTYKKRLELDSYYINNRSLWLDIKIFFKTILVVIKKDGAE